MDEVEPQAQEETPVVEESGEPQAPRSAKYWQSKAEEFERKYRRQEKLNSIIAAHPGLTPDDFRGVHPDEFERLASRLAAVNPSPPAAEPEDITPQIPEQVQQAVTQMNRTAGGVGTPQTVEPMSRQQADQLMRDGKLSWNEMSDKIRRGEIMLEHVDIPEHLRR